MTRTKRTRNLVALSAAACAALLLASSPAGAQYVPAPPPPPPPPPMAPPSAAPAAAPVAASVVAVRRGLTLGGGLGVGRIGAGEAEIECVDCDRNAAASVDLHAGWMMSPRLAVELELWIAGQALDAAGDSSLVQSMVLIAAQYWLKPRWWVKAGIGSASLTQHYAPTGDSTELAQGAAVMAAIGYEAYRHRSFVLDLQLRAGAAQYEDLADDYTQGSLQIGVSWY